MTGRNDARAALVSFVAGAKPADRTRRVAATVLLLEHPDDRVLARALHSGSLAIDERFLVQYCGAAPKDTLTVLAGMPVVRRLRPHLFENLWRAARRTAKTDSHRSALGSALAAYLRAWPRAARRFRGDVRSYLHSPRPALRLRGLELAGLMDQVGDDDLAVVQDSLASRNPFVRMAALFGIHQIASRRAPVPRAMRRFVASPVIREMVRGLASQDRDAHVRLGARNCLASLR
jgi:hypothetical protein